MTAVLDLHGRKSATPAPSAGFDLGAGRRTQLCALKGRFFERKVSGKMLGQGGFGITYIGWDLPWSGRSPSRNTSPSGQVSRNPGSRDLTWYTNEQSRQARQNGMQMFLKEARKMSKVDNLTNVVRVRDIFQENETAYIVMDFVEGETLKARCWIRPALWTWKQAKDIFLPAIQAME